MSAIRFWTTVKGNLPHLSFIFHKPEPLGTEFKKIVFLSHGTCYSLNYREESKV